MIKILIGILMLGLVIIVHEFGHFVAARLFGVTVETFSVGWGPVLFRKKRGDTEYRLSLLPLGGYCGMKGEHAFSEALEKNLDAIPREEGSFYGIHPAKRMLVAFAGPFFNLLFAAIALALVSAVGYSYNTYDNRIVPASAYDAETGQNPVDMAGLKEGDRIVSLDGHKIETFTDIQQFISTHPGENLSMEYERDGTIFTSRITPNLDKKQGTGKIGIYPYIPLVIGSVKAGSAAETAGLKKGDVITAVNGTTVTQYLQFEAQLKSKPEQITVTANRNGTAADYRLVLLYTDKGVEAGLGWQTVPVTVKGTDLIESVKNGVIETGKTIQLTIKSIGLLFRGVDVTEAVSGPVRITMMIGEVAETGFSGLAQFLAIICVSLFLMNLLPIPVLDGGLILFAVIEIFNRKPLKPKTLYYVQFIGIAFIVALFILAISSDIRYLIK
jgi:regulator of sigma E protease